MNTEKKLFYKTVASLVLPMAVQNLINVGVTSADVIMLGKVGETVLSGASLAGQIYFIMTLIFFGLTSGAAVLTSQYWGKHDIDTIEKILGISLRIGILTGVFFTVVALLIPETLMRLFTSEQAVITEGVKYLKIVACSYVVSGITMVYLNVVRSVERVVIATVTYSISLVVNIILNAVFIFGLLGMPVMGIQGAALGTLIARITELVIVFFYAFKINTTVRVRLKYIFHREALLMRDFRKYAMPVMINELAWGSGMAVISAIVGHLGSAAVAAYSVTQVSRQLAMVVSHGVASATAIMCGKAIGERQEKKAETYAKRLTVLTVILGVLGGILILAITPLLKEVVNLTPLAQSYLTTMLRIMAVYVIVQSFNCTMIVGIFRSGGDTIYGLILDVGGLWGGSILLGAFCAFVLRIPMPWVYIVLCCDEFLKLPFSFQRYKTKRWLRNVTREG